MSGRPFLVVLLLIVIVLFPPLMRWPLAHLPAYADAAHGRTGTTAQAGHPGSVDGLTVDGYTVAASNENERRDQENRRGREDNQHSDNEDEDWTPLPPPRVQQPAPPLRLPVRYTRACKAPNRSR